MIEVRNRSVMNERGAQASDATIASGPLTERGTVTELRPSTLPVMRDGQNGADGLGRLVADWEEGRTPSDLSDYLPDPAKIRRAALIELVGITVPSIPNYSKNHYRPSSCTRSSGCGSRVGRTSQQPSTSASFPCRQRVSSRCSTVIRWPVAKT